MSWEAIGGIIGLISLLMNFGLAFALKRRTDEVEVSGHITTRPAPDQVTVQHMNFVLGDYATKEQLADIEDQLGNKIDQKFSMLDSKRSADVAGLHEKVNQTQQAVAALKDRTEMQTALLSNMDAKLTNLMGRREVR
jgi:hypothetical protein